MKGIHRFALGAIYALIPIVSNADTLTLPSGRTIAGTVIQTNGDEIVLLTKYGTYNFAKPNLKSIKLDTPEQQGVTVKTRLADLQTVAFSVSGRSWASGFEQIPATVIDKGVLKHVPYASFRCGNNYEVNIYGDLERPAGIEIGVYRQLLNSAEAKQNCLKAMSALLARSSDREILQSLTLQKDVKTLEGLTFEVTPPTDEDAYQGWWISVYSVQELNAARATDQELKRITVAKADVAAGKQENDWSPDAIKLARLEPNRFSFTTKSGTVIKDAALKPYIEGVSVIWTEEGGSGGVVKLGELPEELQHRFAYDSGKAAVAEAAEKDKQARDAEARAALAAQQAQMQQLTGSEPVGQSSSSLDSPSYFGYSSSPKSGHYSMGGSVYVHGYYRKNGTYVHSYTRRK